MLPTPIAVITAARCWSNPATFGGQPELLGRELLQWGVANLTHALDLRFGLAPKAVLSLRDVPGLTSQGRHCHFDRK
jgi:hypothetical protein